MNDTLKVIEKRYSCRNFTGELPSDEELKVIAKAGVQAPSSINNQPWRIIVVKNKELISELEQEGIKQLKLMEDQSFYNSIKERGGDLFYNAPTIIFVPISKNQHERALLDCGIVTENIALAATSLSLGNVIVGLARLAFNDDEKRAYFKEKLGFPYGYTFGSAILVGKSKEEKEPHKPDMSKISFVE